MKKTQGPLIFVGDGSELSVGLFSRLLEGAIAIPESFVKDRSPGMPIERLAANNIERLARVQSTGPYRLLGYGWGALVAYEMAYQLIANDQAVDFIGMIHCPRPGNAPKHGVRSADVADAINQYSPQPLPIRVHLFVVASAIPRDHDSSLGWGELPGTTLRLEIIDGIELPILQLSNVQRIAAAIQHALNEAPGNRQPTRTAYSPEVTLQLGARDSPDIYCVPGAGASITCFMSLTAALGEEVTVHGLQPRGLDGMLTPHGTVEAAAAMYICAVRKITPRGPYRLLGHSFGGWVVFEMARRLVAAGQPVAPVVLLDTQPPSESQTQPRFYGQAAALIRLIDILEEVSGEKSGLTLSDLESLDYDAQKWKFMQFMKKARLLPQSAKIDAVHHLVRTFSMNLNTRYCPTGIFPGEIILLQAQIPSARQDLFQEDDLDSRSAAEAWKKYAARATPMIVPGRHMTMLQSPGIDVIAKCIREYWT